MTEKGKEGRGVEATARRLAPTVSTEVGITPGSRLRDPAYMPREASSRNLEAWGNLFYRNYAVSFKSLLSRLCGFRSTVPNLVII